MKHPMPINLMTTHEVEEQGWVAEARDMDGHLISTLAFRGDIPINENLRSLGEFIADYEDDGCVVQVFTGRLAKEFT